ncbi:MAG: hypothetical protein ABH821_03455 [archaeon]
MKRNLSPWVEKQRKRPTKPGPVHVILSGHPPGEPIYSRSKRDKKVVEHLTGALREDAGSLDREFLDEFQKQGIMSQVLPSERASELINKRETYQYLELLKLSKQVPKYLSDRIMKKALGQPLTRSEISRIKMDKEIIESHGRKEAFIGEAAGLEKLLELDKINLEFINNPIKFEKIFFAKEKKEKLQHIISYFNQIIQTEAKAINLRDDLVVETVKRLYGKGIKPLDLIYGSAHLKLKKRLKKEIPETTSERRVKFYSWYERLAIRIISNPRARISQSDAKKGALSFVLKYKALFPKRIFPKIKDYKIREHQKMLVDFIETELINNLSENQLNNALTTGDVNNSIDLLLESNGLPKKPASNDLRKFLAKSSYWKKQGKRKFFEIILR